MRICEMNPIERSCDEGCTDHTTPHSTYIISRYANIATFHGQRHRNRGFSIESGLFMPGNGPRDFMERGCLFSEYPQAVFKLGLFPQGSVGNSIRPELQDNAGLFVSAKLRPTQLAGHAANQIPRVWPTSPRSHTRPSTLRAINHITISAQYPTNQSIVGLESKKLGGVF
jgi:hypothetical protein